MTGPVGGRPGTLPVSIWLPSPPSSPSSSPASKTERLRLGISRAGRTVFPARGAVLSHGLKAWDTRWGLAVSPELSGGCSEHLR